MEVYENGSLQLTKIGPLGPFANNAYIIADRDAGEAIIVDMPSQSEQALEAARGLRVLAVLLTHTHPDHWADYEAVKKATGAPVYCHPAEILMPADRIDVPLADGDHLAVGAASVMVVHTPGHTPGSCCFQVGRYLISGDTLFPGGPGHTTSPENLRQTITSITERLYTLPGDTLVLPGHGDNTTIEKSRQEYAVFASRPHRPDLHGDVLWESS